MLQVLHKAASAGENDVVVKNLALLVHGYKPAEIFERNLSSTDL